MIVVSLLLIGVAVILLVTGLVQPSSGMLSGSIGASLLAAVMLLVAARQSLAPRRAAVAGAGWDPAGHPPDVAAGPGGETWGADPEAARGTIPQQAGASGTDRAESAGAGTWTDAPATGSTDDPDRDPVEDPPDEPAAQQVSAADAARVSRLATDVLVVDGRPRYHLAGCVHLLGRDSEPLPVSEAIELGFTPCSLCEPDSALLADARRV